MSDGYRASDFQDENVLEICFIMMYETVTQSLMNCMLKMIKMVNYMLGFFFYHIQILKICNTVSFCVFKIVLAILSPVNSHAFLN